MNGQLFVIRIRSCFSFFHVNTLAYLWRQLFREHHYLCSRTIQHAERKRKLLNKVSRVFNGREMDFHYGGGLGDGRENDAESHRRKSVLVFKDATHLRHTIRASALEKFTTIYESIGNRVAGDGYRCCCRCGDKTKRRGNIYLDAADGVRPLMVRKGCCQPYDLYVLYISSVNGHSQINSDG